MVSIPGVPSVLLYLGFLILISIFLLIDLGLFNKKTHRISVKEALIWTGVWFSLAMAFNVFIFFEFGRDPALKYLTGYLMEKALSVDNLFVMLAIFTGFKILPEYRHKVLFWGIAGAIVLRALMIFIGSSLVNTFEWLLMIFGAFLIYAGIKMFYKDDDEFDPHETWIFRTIHKIVPISKDTTTSKFFIKKDNGKLELTILFIALLVIEFSDVLFALDSIPAIFGITTDPFLVLTSNIFAILGLRSLYFVLERANEVFYYLNYGLGIILAFVGVKMIIAEWFHISTALSLIIILVVLGVSMAGSVLRKRDMKIEEAEEKKEEAEHKNKRKKRK